VGDANQGFKQAASFARGASAWFRQLVGREHEVTRLAARGNHFDLVPGGARRSESMTQVLLDVTSCHSKLVRKR